VETPEELQSPARPQDTIYAHIEKDCLDAAADLPLPSALSASDFGRVTKARPWPYWPKPIYSMPIWQPLPLSAQNAQAAEALGYQLTSRFTDNFNALPRTIRK